MTDCDLLRIEKKAVMLALPSGTNIVRPVCTILIGAEHPILKDLVDQLFNSSGKRLAEVGSPMPFKAILTRSWAAQKHERTSWVAYGSTSWGRSTHHYLKEYPQHCHRHGSSGGD